MPLPPYRETCFRCLRAASVCLCPEIRPFRAAFEVVLLQHPKERKNSIGTARFTHLTLEGSRLYPGIGFSDHPGVSRILDDPNRFSVVLFPGERSTNLSTDRESFVRSIPDGRSLVVFVIDGTWSQAKGLLRRSPNLSALPRVSFSPDRPSEYKIRRQPSPECLSTVEATARLVELLDPDSPAERLRRPFVRMVDDQLERATQGRARKEAKAAG